MKHIIIFFIFFISIKLNAQEIMFNSHVKNGVIVNEETTFIFTQDGISINGDLFNITSMKGDENKRTHLCENGDIIIVIGDKILNTIKWIHKDTIRVFLTPYK